VTEYPYILVDVALISYVKTPSEFAHACCNLILVWPAEKFRRPYVPCTRLTHGKNTFVFIALRETEVGESLKQMLLPYAASYLASVQVLHQFEAMGRSRPFKFEPLWDFQKEIAFHVSLRVS
jgi:hypothetical protein